MNTEYIEYTIKMLELCVNEYKRKDSDTKSIKRLMDRIIREFDNHKRPLKSQAAQALFPNFDLSNLSWSNQCKIDPKRENWFTNIRIRSK